MDTNKIVYDWRNKDEYSEEEIANITSILDNFDVEAIKSEKWSDGYSVALKDKSSGLVFWMDFTQNDIEITGDWNQYIFHTNNSDDRIRQAIQSSYIESGTDPDTMEGYPTAFVACEEGGFNYLVDNGLVISTEDGYEFAEKFEEGLGEVSKNRKIVEEDGDENDDMPNEDIEEDEEEEDDLETLLQEYMDKNPLYERVVSEIIEDSEGYDRPTKAERIQARIGDVLHGLATGVVGSLVYYSDTTKFFDEYWDEIYDILDNLEESMVSVYDYVKQYVSETEILMGTDQTKNWIVWYVYEEIASNLSDAIETM